MRQERKRLGYGIEEPEYVVHGYENEYFAKAKMLIRSADVIIYGGAQGAFAKPSLYRDKTVLYYSERLFKTRPQKWQLLLKAIKYYFRFTYRRNSFLLCAGAYTAADFAKTHTFKNRCYRWGYFPAAKRYDIANLTKHKDKRKILWCGRLLSWKHPECAIEVARRLKSDGIDFCMDIIGIGECEDQMKALIAKHHLDDCVRLLGAMTPDEVRLYMETAGIFIFTSDRQEGWGAVLNEAMNSVCAVVASHEIGAVPYLVEDNKNAMIYPSSDTDTLYQKVRYLLENTVEQERLGRAAYQTIVSEWNAEVAAKRLITLSKHILEGEAPDNLYTSGPCSKAEILKDNWLRED